ncbi:MAG: kynureninase [Phycisphaerales bacterium]|nr:kynureninase [Phycisphaerales bacterium]
MTVFLDDFREDEAYAQELEARDPVASRRTEFCVPPMPGDPGREAIYMCGNSLGLMPRRTTPAVQAFLEDWGRFGVEGHFEARDSWYDYHEALRAPVARVVGALPHEVVVMNTLTVNLHLLMTSFYRPAGERRCILIDGPCFPSDVYAVKSQLRLHGVDPDEGLLWARPREGERHIRAEDVEDLLAREGARIALVLFAAVNYYSGQRYEMKRITDAARRAGCMVGWDCAHGFGNVPLNLHEVGADFAAWCHYKYGNAGAGAIAGAFVHERWVRGLDADAYAALPRCEGWWGNDPATRFRMGPDFTPVRSADAWSLSNPPILSMIPVKCSLGLFDEVGIEALRERSVRLTGYLERLLAQVRDKGVEIITTSDAAARGCQLSLVVPGGRAAFERLQSGGVMCDFREPDVIRVAPTPLYNTYADCRRFVGALRDALV